MSRERNYGGPHKTEPATDLTRWRLLCERGRWGGYNWKDDSGGSTTHRTMSNSRAFWRDTRWGATDGHWAYDYGGPLFLMAGWSPPTEGMLIVCYITKVELCAEKKAEMIRYLRSVECPSGGWGLYDSSN
ncbi:LOW QUALITY PROTEIN: lanosterol synthase-like [Octopus sinensis]|uniref:LOW QUALITY PROTEIN: lanosterol synthase-like n=1 Tax=Octopus sinensis TaxID=2607531 RepID=A0A7E6EJW5_9MOLL|nr:LOW QUALITY PROTEIN: lanosterol synthase-like [Octopus sinensis]